jgi:xanthine dehydrogenase accessory factor
VPLIARGTSRSERIAVGGGESTSKDAESPEAFFEVHAPKPHLILVGAGIVAMPLAELARTVGFHVTVVDARPRFASRERFPNANDLRIGIASDIVAQLPLVPATAVVLTIHDYKVEVPVLRAVLSSRAGYVGMLGNRHRGRAVLDLLRQQGVPEDQLARVHVPIGLDIGGQTAAEIATSILAEVIAVRSGKGVNSLRDSPPPAGAHKELRSG